MKQEREEVRSLALCSQFSLEQWSLGQSRKKSEFLLTQGVRNEASNRVARKRTAIDA